MSLCYKRLWKLLIDRGMTRTEMRLAAGISTSTLAKLNRGEEVNTAITPIMLIFVFMFISVMTSMGSGNVDSTLMRICSYIPFTSPMAMFTRIALSDVAMHEIIISIAILIGSVFGVGYIAARIYRVGVLMYGTPPKLGNIIKMVFAKR